MKDHIRGDEGTVEDEGGDVDEPLPGFESLPPDAEREVDGHRETGTTHEEDKKREDFRGRKRHRYMYRLGSVGTYRSFVNCFGYFLCLTRCFDLATPKAGSLPILKRSDYMCGIVGYVTVSKEINAIAEGVNALRRLEYRGYDSAGIAFFSRGNLYVAKKKGGIGEGLVPEVRAQQKTGGVPETASIAILHTRWATHGEANDANAHPHTDCSGRIAVVHNGIVENYLELKGELERKGHIFCSETDTEVIAHLIEELRKDESTLEAAIRAALKRLCGTYGLLILAAEEPNTLFVAKNGSPVLVGVGKGEYVVASDSSAILSRTRDVFSLDDGEWCRITAEGHHIFRLDGNQVPKKTIETIEWSPEEAEKGGYPHFMLKEIMEQPHTIEDALRGRVHVKTGTARLGGISSVEAALREACSFWLVSCGTSFHAGMVGEYLLEDIAGVPARAICASEFRYRNPVLNKRSVAIALSQSGETADTLAAIEEVKRKGALALGIVNVVGSTIARKTDAGVYTHAGPEISVASTKAFTSQLTVLALLALSIGRQRSVSLSFGEEFVERLMQIPEQVSRILVQADAIQEAAERYVSCENFFYLGRRYSMPVAFEGALKIKEIAYVHAEAYPAGEMKHGPLALVEDGFPGVFVAPCDSVYEKTVSNMQEVKARKGKIIAVTTEGNTELLKKGLADECFFIPETLEPLSPLLSIIPLQLFAYFVAAARGEAIDRPRNLAKSVTVE